MLRLQLIVAGADRERARRGMLKALKRFRVDGVTTTIPLHERILTHERFVSGTYDTDLVEQVLNSAEH